MFNHPRVSLWSCCFVFNLSLRMHPWYRYYNWSPKKTKFLHCLPLKHKYLQNDTVLCTYWRRSIVFLKNHFGECNQIGCSEWISVKTRKFFKCEKNQMKVVWSCFKILYGWNYHRSLLITQNIFENKSMKYNIEERLSRLQFRKRLLITQLSE